MRLLTTHYITLQKHAYLVHMSHLKTYLSHVIYIYTDYSQDCPIYWVLHSIHSIINFQGKENISYYHV